MHQFELKLSGQIIPVSVNKQRRYRRLCMKVSDKGLAITVPSASSEKELKQFINKNSGWILKKYILQKDRFHNLPNLIEGENIPFKGLFFPLELRNVDEVIFDGESFIIPDNNQKKELLIDWYIQEAVAIMLNLLQIWQDDLGEGLKEIKLKNMSSRWGSCTVKGVVSLNWRLILAPETVFEYVFIHELSHLKVKSHGREFWKLVEQEIPNHKKHRAWLRKNGFMLTNFPVPVDSSTTVAKIKINQEGNVLTGFFQKNR